ncbi:DUF4296 domain-containing protein [Gracilimonas mengyeensis]|uniref:DUF4296 domain-containing protein n=1 Tax=Gracilimonas mengyeensis TaxID=1302730 RepID=A0A521E2M4_9BACT|nr:DUF4296 domain-containing protein [Gracilimonas mengyeensis]SMO77350.1 protein of unknown function [Gracilimonas mengyeensis]
MALKRIISYSTLGILFLFAGCRGVEKPQPPDNLLPEPVYMDVMIELQHIRTYASARPDSVNVDSLKQLVFEKYEIEEAAFASSHKFYQSDVQAQIERIEAATAWLEHKEKNLQAHIDSMKAVYSNHPDSVALADSLSAADSLSPQDSVAIADSLINRDTLGN